MRRLAGTTRRGKIAAAAFAVAAAVLAAVAVWSSGALPQVGGGNTVTPVGALEFPVDGILEGGRTYRFPDGSWLIDVPEGLRLRYSSTSESPTGTQHGFTDPETGSLISIEEHTGEVNRFVQEFVVGDDAAAANARLDRFETAFRRPPGYVEPVPAQAQAEPELSPDGIPYLLDFEEFTGGRTYTIQGHEEWRIPMPADLDGTFYMNSPTPDGTQHYAFVGVGWAIFLNPATGYSYTHGNPEPHLVAAVATLQITFATLAATPESEE